MQTAPTSSLNSVFFMRTPTVSIALLGSAVVTRTTPTKPHLLATENQTMTNLKRELMQKRDALRRSLADELSHLSALREPTRGDVADWALDSVSGELNSQMAEFDSQKLAKIEEALARMDRGAYGVCEQCNQPISAARLEALPDSTLCIDCQRGEERVASNKFGNLPSMLNEPGPISPEVNSDAY